MQLSNHIYRVFHSNLISMSKGLARPCMPIKVNILENVYVVLIAG